MDSKRWLIREWDDGCVLFDRQTGDTHALDPLSTEVLKLDSAIRREPLLVSQRLAAQLGIDDQQLLPGIKAALEQLKRLNIS